MLFFSDEAAVMGFPEGAVVPTWGHLNCYGVAAWMDGTVFVASYTSSAGNSRSRSSARNAIAPRRTNPGLRPQTLFLPCEA